MTKEEFEKFMVTYKPKNFKYKFIITDDEFQEEILKLQIPGDFSVNDELDTINDDELVREAIGSDFTSYGNNIKKAKEPTLIEEGVYVSKIIITKTGKPLLDVQISHFEYKENNYMAIKFVYEKFYILEIFITI
jgi:hypothetical protein